MQILDQWSPGEERTALGDGEVHVWRVRLDRAVAAPDVLSNDEKARLRRFTAHKAGRDFGVMRTTLRSILSHYLALPPREMIFRENDHGKPSLADNALYFNISHSGDLGLVAVTASGDVGVDIEKVSPHRGTRDIAARFFSPGETAALDGVPNDDQVRAFFRCWSRKESVIKALGEGLACPLSSFDVSLDAGDARLVAFRREGVRHDAWNMIHIHADKNYEAAAAVIGPCRTVRGFDFYA